MCTGLTKVGMPVSDLGVQPEDPTIELGDFYNMLVQDDWWAIRYNVFITNKQTIAFGGRYRDVFSVSRGVLRERTQSHD